MHAHPKGPNTDIKGTAFLLAIKENSEIMLITPKAAATYAPCGFFKDSPEIILHAK
jgi:hypothetical protein